MAQFFLATMAGSQLRASSLKCAVGTCGLAVDSKFNKGKGKPVEDYMSDNVFKLSKLSMMEGSHRVCMAQDLMRDDEKLKKISADALAKCID